MKIKNRKFRAFSSVLKTMLSWEDLINSYSACQIFVNYKKHGLSTMEFTGCLDRNSTEVYENDRAIYYTTHHEYMSASDAFGVEPEMEFDCGSDIHRMYEGVIKVYPSTGVVLASCKVYECVSEGEYPWEVKAEDWEFKKSMSYKKVSCTRERLEVTGNVYE